MDSEIRTDELRAKPERGELEIERLDSGYIVSIYAAEGPSVRVAFEDARGVADEVMRWLGYEVNEDEEPVYVLTDKAREWLDAPKREREWLDTLKRGSGREFEHYPSSVETDGAAW